MNKRIYAVDVSVEFKRNGATDLKAIVSLEIEPGQEILANKLMDACQRAVANCVDELEKEHARN